MSEKHPTAGPAPVPVAAPETPAAAEPPQPAEPGPAPVPAAAEAPAAEQPAAEAPPAIKPHTEEAGLLQAAPPADAATPEPAAAAPEPAPGAVAPAYEFAVPENLTVPLERLEELTSVMREANVPKEQAEKLWGMHTTAMEEFAQQTLQAQHDAFAEYRRNMRNQIISDPALGGAGFETNKAAANRMLQLFVPTEHRGEFDRFLSETGATDHPALFRFLVNLAKYHDEPQSGPPPSPSPLPPRAAQGPRPRGGTAADRSGGTRFEYDFPRGNGRG